MALDALRLLELAPRPRVDARLLADASDPFDLELEEDEPRRDEARLDPRLDEPLRLLVAITLQPPL
ncbi:MAG: hypothetical protein JOZ73_00050 [Solirubrobacterales bacterium]|nr:hypothetical protein [Solirubrobacterales bacterium]